MPRRPAGGGSGFDPRGFELEADLIRVLANPKRLMILSHLGRGPSTVTEIARSLDLSLQNTSQHLRLMRDRAIVRAERAGREVRYALTSPVIPRACALVRQALLAEARSRPSHVEANETAATGAGFGVEAARSRRAIVAEE
jgi:DNA-binding transcriptional ArsR family regulator